MFVGFIIGIGSCLHCLGMCGPIAMALPLKRTSNWTLAFGALQYNFGRILAYSFLGFTLGGVGLSVDSVRGMQLLSIVAGLFMIAFAWRGVLGVSQVEQTRLVGKISMFVGQNIGRIMRSRSPFKLLGIGFMNGFLPCAMVFVGLANAVIQGAPLLGGLAMFSFGLGTFPAMFGIAFFAAKISNSWRLKLSKSVPYLITAVGIMVILRGMNLGIPYLSPQISVNSTEQLENSEKTQVEIICCKP